MKNYTDIEQLLDKYWEGETSLKEEKILQDFFTTETVPLEFQAFKPLFEAKVEKPEQTELSPDFEDSLLAKLEVETKVVPLNTSNNQVSTIQSIQASELRRWRWMAGIAASIALILAVYIVMPKTTNNVEFAKTELSKEEHKEALKAYEQTKMALFFVSSHMNQGTQKAAKGLNKVKNLNAVIEDLDN